MSILWNTDPSRKQHEPGEMAQSVECFSPGMIT